MITVSDITKRFGKSTALNGVSLEVASGSVFGLVGSNGAGKSTLMRILAGVYRQDGGEVLFDGVPVYENPAVKEQIAFAADAPFFMAVTPKLIANWYAGVYPTFDKNRFFELIDRFGLPRDKSLLTFSKGMLQQLFATCAFARRPKYLFFDETFDGLDPIMRGLCKRVLTEEVIDRGCTVVITSHSLRELEDVCDQLALLHRGGLVLQSDVTKLRTKSAKVQIGFREPPSDEALNAALEGLDVAHRSHVGSVDTLIIRADEDEIRAKLGTLSPDVFDVLPLSLEEVFTYELETLGYTPGEF